MQRPSVGKTRGPYEARAPIDVQNRNAVQAGHHRLYHYQGYNPEHLADMIARQRIHCATPGKLNDPWDCRPWFSPSVLQNDPAEMERFLEFLYQSAVAYVDPGLRKAYDDKMRSDPAALRESLAGLSRTVQEEIARRRIYCLTPHADNILMWSHYADDHRGVCLEFSTSVQLFATAREVQYAREYP